MAAIGPREAGPGPAGEGEHRAGVAFGDGAGLDHGGHAAAAALGDDVGLADLAHGLQHVADELGGVGGARELERPQREVIAAQQAHRAAQDPPRRPAPTTALLAQSSVVDHHREVQQLGGGGDVLRGRAEAIGAGGRLGVGHGGAGRQHDEQRPNPRQAGGQEQARIKAGGRAVPAREIAQRGLDRAEVSEQLGPEALGIDGRREAPEPAAAHGRTAARRSEEGRVTGEALRALWGAQARRHTPRPGARRRGPAERPSPEAQ